MSAIRYDTRVCKNDSVIGQPTKIDLDSKVTKDQYVSDEVNTWLDTLSKAIKDRTGRDPNEQIDTNLKESRWPWAIFSLMLCMSV